MAGLYSYDGGGISDSGGGFTASLVASEERAGGGGYPGVFPVACFVQGAGAVLRARGWARNRVRRSAGFARLRLGMW